MLDRNGDGVINNGTELFGDSTPLAAGGKAEDGFAALAQEDTNGDGIVNASDANWANLRVWKDANSDGVSDEGELHTLESQGIAGMYVAKTENTTPLANGNQIADLGLFIRTDGTGGSLAQVTGTLADIDLADNPFYRSFSDTIPSTAQTATLPTMQGSGALRDLREAATLSPALAAIVADYAAAGTKAGQMALVDGVISQWAGSTSFQTGGVVDFVANNFDSQSPNQLFDKAGNPMAIFTQANPLLQMNGLGMVRNIRAAANSNALKIAA